MSGTPDTGPGREIPARFSREVGRAFRQIARDPEYRDLLARLKYAFEFRKQFPWLEESNEHGLTKALGNAVICTSGFDDDPTPPFSVSRQPVGREFRSQLQSAIRELVSDPSEAGMLAFALAGRNQDINALTAQDLKDPIISGLERYSSNAGQGTGLNPW